MKAPLRKNIYVEEKKNKKLKSKRNSIFMRLNLHSLEKMKNLTTNFSLICSTKNCRNLKLNCQMKALQRRKKKYVEGKKNIQEIEM